MSRLTLYQMAFCQRLISLTGIPPDFFKEDEKSYHVMYGYDFKDYVPGLNAMVKYVYGHDFKAANGEKNHETESNVILNYAFQQPFLKGVALQYIRIDYNVKHGNDFGEDRLFVNYTKKVLITFDSI